MRGPRRFLTSAVPVPNVNLAPVVAVSQALSIRGKRDRPERYTAIERFRFKLLGLRLPDSDRTILARTGDLGALG